MSPKFKDQEVRGQVKTTFLKASNWGQTVSERILVVAYFKFMLFQL